MSKFKLGLNLPTDPRWVNIAEMQIGDILIDHAWCEQKAASSCIALIINFSDKQELLEQVAPVVAEEWGHFRKVVKELNKRGFKLGRPRTDTYVKELLKQERKNLERDASLVEKLLICALIEARSCERFRLLSLHISEPELREFYYEFMVAEASHYRMFLDLATLYMPHDYVNQRWAEFLEAEAQIVSRLEVRGDRMH